MTLELTLTDIAGGGKPFAGVAVYVWHCTREGEYSLYSQNVQDENFLRGVQIADTAGKVRFTSIFPGCYSGRWPHVHFEVYPDQAGIADAANAIATSQVALPQPACEQVYAQSGYEASVANLARLSLASDNVFGDDSAALQLATVTGDVTSGYAVALPVAVDTTTTPSAAGGRGGPPPSR
jgi:protocatechuate 3,4-dioxygenase beta subunit